MGSGIAFTTPPLMATDSFFVAVSNGVCEGPRKKVIAIVQPLQPLTGTGYSTCPGDNGTLQINPVFGATQYYWYNAATGGTLIHQGVTFITAPLFNTTTYYVSYLKRGCESARIPLTVTITPLPLLTANNVTICANNVAQPSISPINNATQYLWYNANTGGSLIHTGISYTTPILNTTTVYYVSYKNGNCESGRTAVTVTVNTLPIATAVTSNSPLCEHQTLQLNTATTPNVNYLWTGPNGFTSTMQNPTIVDVIEANHQGFYTLQLTSTATNCKSVPVSVLVDIHHFPDNIIAVNNSPKCEGSNINLDASSLFGASYSWIGPNAFTSSLKHQY
ncbi:MAG: hypothetical protein IPP48_03885 [Chitinophagaceae bacterium]|nr:hypothetical protein [Chitinophagaceae bacterium]